jgi:benzoate/toluate 1,2-dioxygenase alpha subunit
VDRYPNSEIQVNRGVSKYGYDGNWKLQIENSMDYYHVLFVHRSWMDMVKERTGYDIDSSFKYGSANNAVYFGSGHGATIARGDMLESSYVGQGSLYPPNFRDEAWEQRVGPLKSKWAKKFSEHLLIFPNLLIMEAPAMQIRVVRPLAPDKTEVTGYSYYPKGMSPEYIAKNLRAYEDFLGPSGNGTPDDLAAFRLNHEGFQAKGAPWSDLSKGYTRETSDIDLQELGPLEAAGEITDDTHYRGFYRYWRDLLSQD